MLVERAEKWMKINADIATALERIGQRALPANFWVA